MLVVMAEKEIGARSYRPSSPVPRERAALTGLRDAAGSQEQSTGLGCAAPESALRASNAPRAVPLWQARSARLCGRHPSGESSLRSDQRQNRSYESDFHRHSALLLLLWQVLPMAPIPTSVTPGQSPVGVGVDQFAVTVCRSTPTTESHLRLSLRINTFLI